MATCEAMPRHTRRRDVRAGVGQSTYACTTWTHMLAVFAADRLSAAALSHRLVMTCYHARAHVLQSTPYLTGKGPRNGHTRQDAERCTDDLHRNTIGGNTPTVQRSEQIPISRGAAERATGSDQCKDYAGRTRTRPNEAPRGERPMWDDSQVQIKSAGRGGRYRISRKGDSGRTSNNATPPAAHSHVTPMLVPDLGGRLPVSRCSLGSHNEKRHLRQLAVRCGARAACSAHVCAARVHRPGSACPGLQGPKSQQPPPSRRKAARASAGDAGRGGARACARSAHVCTARRHGPGSAGARGGAGAAS